MKAIQNLKPNVDLESLEQSLGKLDQETYPDYTADWPKEELITAIQEGIESGDSGVFSLADYCKAFARGAH